MSLVSKDLPPWLKTKKMLRTWKQVSADLQVASVLRKESPSTFAAS